MAIRDSGQRVIIDGPCLSACTLVLGVIPRERICVTRRARLGFHAAWHHGENGRPITSRGGTQLLMAVYPAEREELDQPARRPHARDEVSHRPRARLDVSDLAANLREISFTCIRCAANAATRPAAAISAIAP